MTEATTAKILIIDDEPQIRRFLGISLRAAGYQTCEAATGAEGLGELAASQPNLVILDLGLTDMDGGEVLEHIRTLSEVPVLILSVRSAEQEKVRLLDAGANDYLTKPFGLQEMLARVRALLRHHQPKDTDTNGLYDDGHLCIDLKNRQVWLEGLEVSLTRKEYHLLSILVKNAGRTLTQPQLLKEVWGPSHIEDTHYLRVAVSKIRSKLGEDALNPKYIITENGVGLRFRFAPTST